MTISSRLEMEVRETNRKKIAFAILIISISAGSGLFAAVRVSGSISPKPGPVMFSYAVKWICNAPSTSVILPPFDSKNAEKIGLVTGEYKTDINVHNPSNASMNAFIQKKFVLSVPESPTPISPFVFRSVALHPDGAFFIDCNDIFAVLFTDPTAMSIIISNGGAAKGFVILTTGLMPSGSPLLDVVAEYSQIGWNCLLVPTCVAVGSALDVEQIPARPFAP